VVEKCASEAKIVAAEQEAKKIVEAAKKAADRAAFEAAGGIAGAASTSAKADGGGGGAFVNPLLAASSLVDAPEIDEKTPSAMEAAPGGSPEVIVHDEKTAAQLDELSPEEQAMSGAVSASVGEGSDDEEDNTAALAEGRLQPPVSGAE
jgi:hypothetical protein